MVSELEHGDASMGSCVHDAKPSTFLQLKTVRFKQQALGHLPILSIVLCIESEFM